jgi:hypothetical protein
MSDPQNTFKAMSIHMAANLIDQLAILLDDEGIELEPMEIKINGEVTGSLDIAALTRVLRNIGDELKPMVVNTDVQDNRTDDEPEGA